MQTLGAQGLAPAWTPLGAAAQILAAAGFSGSRLFSLADIRVSAAMDLAKMGPAAKDAVPYLITNLRHRESQVRLTAAWALKEIGPGAAGAYPDLLNCEPTAHR